MRVLMIAPPGAGKGTQGALIAAHFGIPHIATGELLRDHVARRTPLGEAVQAYLGRGELVPDQVVLEMVREELVAAKAAGGGYVLDGIPRNIQQARAAYRIGLELGMTADVALHLQASDEEVTRRLLARAVLEHRSDDTAGVIAQRLALYHEVTSPILAWYRDRGIRAGRKHGTVLHGYPFKRGRMSSPLEHARQGKKAASRAAAASPSTAASPGSDGRSAARRPAGRRLGARPLLSCCRSCSVTAWNLALPQTASSLPNRLLAAPGQSQALSTGRGRAHGRELVRRYRAGLDGPAGTCRQPGRPGTGGETAYPKREATLLALDRGDRRSLAVTRRRPRTPWP